MGNKFTISYGSAAPATSKLLPYELGLDNVTNTLYIGKEGGTSVALNTADIVGAIKRAGDTVVNGHFVYYNTSPVATVSLFHNGSPFELREAGDVGNTQSADVYSPSIGFRWKDVTGAALVMPSDGKFYRINSSGNKYRIYDAQDVIPVTGGGTGATDAAGARSAIEAAAASHAHSTSDITSGTLSVDRGGTGQTTLAAFRNSIGLGDSTSALSIANGGTGANTATGALANIGAASADHTHTAEDVGAAETVHDHSVVRLSLTSINSYMTLTDNSYYIPALRLVVIRFTCYTNGGAAAGSYNLVQVPEGYRPASTVALSAFSAGYIPYAWLLSSGIIAIRATTRIGDYYDVSGCYYVDE